MAPINGSSPRIARMPSCHPFTTATYPKEPGSFEPRSRSRRAPPTTCCWCGMRNRVESNSSHSTGSRPDRSSSLAVLNVLGVKHGGVHMTQAEISGISPFFIVSHVPSSLSFYRDRLGFEITFQGPAPDDIFFGIVRRGGAQILLKDVGVDPLPNYKRDVGKGIARWDAFVIVPDPDALAAEFASRNVEFFEPLKDTHDGLRGFELKDTDGYLLFFGRPR